MILNLQSRPEPRAWSGAAAPPPPVPTALLAEDGTPLLAEDGTPLLSE